MAGRKHKHTVDYFPHYCNPDSKTIFVLESQFGLVGYAIWYKTLEMLGKSKHHYIDLRDDTDLLFVISKFKISKQELEDIYDLLAKMEAIDRDMWKEKIVFSENFISNVEDAYARRKGINVLHKYDLCQHLNIKCKQKSPKESKVKETKEKIDFSEMLNFINKTLKKDYRVINDSVRKKFAARINDGYTKEDIVSSIINASKNDYHKDNNYQYLTPEFFSRANTIDKYMASGTAKQSLRDKYKIGNIT
jgi:uncharacterized phage protein (TIGR02220 family)